MLRDAVADNPYVVPPLLVETENGIQVGKVRCSKTRFQSSNKLFHKGKSLPSGAGVVYKRGLR